MGLDAVVYKHRTKLPLDPESAGLRIEDRTGEWYSETNDVPGLIKAVGLEALHKRLGNVSLIGALSAEVAAFLPARSLLLSNILYEGGHAGDIIPREKTATLRAELALLRSHDSELSLELRLLLQDLEELSMAAEENRNPIVFV